MLRDDQQNLMDTVDTYRQQILDAERFIWQHPETGYREWQSSAYMEKAFVALGYTLVKAGDIPGFYTDLDTGRPGPRLLILAELDALACPTHPEAVDGKAHACGHHAQCAALLGVAAALSRPGALDRLSGSIRLMVVPAEELIEIAWRESLRQQGTIRYYGGKVEFMRRGYLDGVDLAFMFHTTSDNKADFGCNAGGNGCLAKRALYHGTAAHAGGSPHEGVNALYAVQAGMQAVNALRETFRDEDHIRVHPIITAGGASVNIIPADVRLESYVRGATLDCIREANGKVSRALAAGAAALGARVTLIDRPGYAPLNNDPRLMEVAKTCLTELVGPERVNFTDRWSTGSTDMGDLSCVMPVMHGYAAGASGMGHGDNYRISDPEKACVQSAKGQLLLAVALLEDDAARARAVLAEAKPHYDGPAAYLEAIEKLSCDLEAVVYDDDGTIRIQTGKR